MTDLQLEPFTVNVYTSPNGQSRVSKLQSYLAWRNFLDLNAPLKLDANGACAECHGALELHGVTPYGTVLCVCRIKTLSGFYASEYSGLRSGFPSGAKLADLQEWGSQDSMTSIYTLKETVADWLRWPTKWLTIMGAPGVGKTHAVSVIAKHFYPWAVYITDGDFEQLVYSYLKNGELEILIQRLENIPILLYDDIGSSHNSDLAKSSLRKIFDYRYKLFIEYITVVTTNLTRKALYNYDDRIADRILDKDISIAIPMRFVESWRTRDTTK